MQRASLSGRALPRLRAARPRPLRHDGPVGRAELARRVQKACYLEGNFLLRSGQRANFYFDKYLFESDPELLSSLAKLLLPLIPPGTEVLAGLELGGVPVATALSLLSGLPQVLVRKQAKAYGTAKLAEGPPVSGRRLLVIEDVVTTGGQVALSAHELRDRDATVEDVLCVIDRRDAGSGEVDKLGLAGLRLWSLFTVDELLRAGGAAHAAKAPSQAAGE